MQNELGEKYNPMSGMEDEGYWIKVMKENEIYYREQELKEKRKERKIKLDKINNLYIQ